MRIIHILSSVMWSGVERYSLDICRHYSNEGYDVLAITRDARAVDDVFRRNGVPVRFAPLGGFFSYGAVKAICEVLNEDHSHTVIHCHDTRDAFCALTARSLLGRRDIRVVLTRHYVRRAGRSPFHKYTYRNVDRLIFVSEAARSRFLSGWQWNKGRFADNVGGVVIHNSINIPLKGVAEEPARGAVTGMYLGRLAPDKGLEQIIGALGMMRGSKLRMRLVGTGHPDYVDSLRRRAEDAGVMEMIDWPRHREDTDGLIRLSHFGVLPSTAPEAFGMSNLEFMSEGRPIICTGNGAQPEYITDRREGILVAPGDVRGLAIEMQRLVADRNLRLALGKAARSRFENELSWPHFIRKLDQQYFFDFSDEKFGKFAEKN